jgi:hypothetical protein
MGGKIVHATGEFTSHAPTPIPVLPDWSPIKVFGGYGAPPEAKRAARAGMPTSQPSRHSTECHLRGGAHVAHQLLAGMEAARNRYADFFGLDCECFAL